MNLSINGQSHELDAPASVADLLQHLGMAERGSPSNATANWCPEACTPNNNCPMATGSKSSRPSAEAKAMNSLPEDKPLIIAGREYRSRLLTGTGKYADLEQTRQATEAAGAEIVTVAIRRSAISARTPTSPICSMSCRPIATPSCPIPPAAFTAEDAVRTCRLARELLDGHKLVKLEVLGDQKTLFPDVTQTIQARPKR
jgi:hypothetical protein